MRHGIRVTYGIGASGNTAFRKLLIEGTLGAHYISYKGYREHRVQSTAGRGYCLHWTRDILGTGYAGYTGLRPLRVWGPWPW